MATKKQPKQTRAAAKAAPKTTRTKAKTQKTKAAAKKTKKAKKAKKASSSSSSSLASASASASSASSSSAAASSSGSDVRAARIEALTSAFTALGAPRPERWARSHVEEGVDQIGRFIFLRALWTRVVKDGRFLDKLRKDQSELTPVVERLLLSGAAEADVVALVRALQVQLLVDVTQILDDPHDNDEGVRWGLWRMDKRGLPLWQLPDLRLDLLDVDPLDDV